MNAHAKEQLVDWLLQMPDILDELRVESLDTMQVILVDAVHDAVAEQELLAEILSYRQNVTGIHNTLFMSPKGQVKHGPRVKVAIDPPTSLNPVSQTASIDFDGQVVVGDVPPALFAQVRQFIELNRQALLDYWNYQTDTDQLRASLKSFD